MKKNKIQPGDLVGWLRESTKGKIQEAGVVIELVYNDSVNLAGAKIAWESGVFWSPLDQVVKLGYSDDNTKR